MCLVVKIMLFYPGILINSKGGIEKVFCTMANEFVERGYEVLAVGFENKKGLPAFPLVNKVKFINAGENHPNKLSFMQRLRRCLFLNKKDRHIYSKNLEDMHIGEFIATIVNAEKPDIIISFNISGTRIIKKCTKINTPVISMLHGGPDIYFTVTDDETKQYFAMSECVQVLLPSFVKELKKWVKHNNVVVIGNAVPQFDMNINYNNKIIVNVARWDRLAKRQELLIRAFSKVSKELSEWKIKFYGGEFTEGYLEYCNNIVKKLGLQEKVEFCGTTNNVYEELKMASVFAFPSAFEGFSLALTEAMSVGLPCIGYKSSPSVNELILDGKNGILCEDGIEPFADALKELMRDYDKRTLYGKQAKEDMKNYAPEFIWDKWEKLINKTVTDYYKKR